MKTKAFISASHMIVKVLACVFTLSLAACGGDDDEAEKSLNPIEEPTEEEILLDKTTPVEFEFNFFKDNFLFDYAGNNYVGSDTVNAFRKTIDLRQGKHHLIWISELEKWAEVISNGVHFRPFLKQVVNTDRRSWFMNKIAYFETDLEVSPYLLPTQNVNYFRYLTFTIWIKVTDVSQNLTLPEKIENGRNISYTEPVIGRIKGIPRPNAIYLDKDEYTEYDTNEGLPVTTGIDLHYYDDPEALKYGLCVNIKELRALCPAKGFENIQPVAEIYDKDGNVLTTTALPNISLQPGYTTILEGPLFSGKTSDWKVTMERYKAY